MQVQKVQNNQSFTGIKLQTVITHAKKINVYKLTEKDKDFAQTILNIIKGQKFPPDKLSIGEGSNKDIFKSVLKSAAENLQDTILMAVENGKKIIGVLKLHNSADNEIAGLVCMNGTKQPERRARESLLLAALRETEKMKDTALIAKSKHFSSSVSGFLNKFGFRTETTPRGKEMFIECEDIQKAIDKYGYYSPNKIILHNYGKDIPMNNVLKVDKK